MFATKTEVTTTRLCSIALHLFASKTMHFNGEVTCNRCSKVVAWWR